MQPSHFSRTHQTPWLEQWVGAGEQREDSRWWQPLLPGHSRSEGTVRQNWGLLHRTLSEGEVARSCLISQSKQQRKTPHKATHCLLGPMSVTHRWCDSLSVYCLHWLQKEPTHLPEKSCLVLDRLSEDSNWICLVSLPNLYTNLRQVSTSTFSSRAPARHTKEQAVPYLHRFFSFWLESAWV